MKILHTMQSPWSIPRITWTTLLTVTALALSAHGAVGPGVASNFGIDGNLLSRSPSGSPYGTTDDWVPGANAASTAVLNNAGVPLDPTHTFHIIDGYGGADLSVFGAASQKVSDNPNTYTWKPGSVPPKDDIHNALFSWRTDGSGNIWVILGADRLSVNGTSYIDFELLQHSLTKNPDSTFTSLGPNGGRTVGDILITIDLTNGGTQATFKVQRWEADGGAPSGFKYHDFTPPSGQAYVAASIDSTVWVPFGAFGSTTYSKNAFGEAALNMTQLLRSLNPCIDIPVVFIRTKASDSPTAELKDFVDPINVQLHLGADANAGPDKVLTCDVTQVTLDGSSTSPNSSYHWTATGGGHIVSGGSTLTPLVNAPGTYILTVTRSYGSLSSSASKPTGSNSPQLSASIEGADCVCSAVDTAIVTRNITPPNANAGADKVLTCVVTQLNLSGSSSTPGATFNWVASGGGHIVSGATTATPLVDATGTYVLTVRNPANGCTAKDTALVTSNTTPPNANAGADKVLTCILTQTSLSGSSSTPGAAFSWSASNGGHIVSGGTTATPLVDAAGTYLLTVTNPSNGCTAKDTASVTADFHKPEVTCTGDELTCDSLLATASVSLPSGSKTLNGLSYLWTPSPVSGQGTAFARYDTPGNKKVVVTILATGCKDSCEAVITQNIRQPELSCRADTITCAKPQATAWVTSSPNDGVSYLWDPAPLSGQGTSQAHYDTPGPKQVIVTILGTGCKDTCTVDVVQNVLKPRLTCTGDALTCDSTEATASVSFELDQSKIPFPFTYLWTPVPLSGQGTAFARYDTPGNKKVVVTYLTTGCKDSCEATITQDVFKPALTCTGDELTCDSLLAWATVSVGVPGSKSLNDVSYVWNPAPVSGQGTPLARYSTPGSKRVVVAFLATGCKDSCEAVITQDVIKPQLNCTGDELTCDSLLASAAVTYATAGSKTVGVNIVWTPSPVSGQGTPFARYSTPGNKKVIVTFPWNGCKDSCEATITQSTSAPNANAGADKVLTCTVTQINLSGSSTTPNVTFSWVASAGGHIVSAGSTATPLVDQAGTYTLTVTNPANGCTATDLALVTRNNTAPNANAGADKVLTCTVTQINLSGSSSTGGATFSWAATGGGHIVTGGSTATPLVDQPGTYTLTVTNPANGCTATDVALVTRNNTAPNANAGADKVMTCTVTQINLSGSSSTAGAIFSWVATGGGHIVSGGSTATPLVDQPGTYTLTVTNPANVCTATDVALVTRNNTAPNANAGADKVLTCTVTQVNLSGSSSTVGATFSWVASGGGHIVSGATTATPLVDQPGTYTLTVTNPANGCTATDVALVTRNNTAPNANAGVDKVLTCTVTQINLSGSSSTVGATFSWVASGGGHIVSGNSTATPLVDQPGTYTLTVTDPANGCASTDVAVVTKTVNRVPVCVVPRDTSITTQVVPFQVCLPVSGTDVDGDVVTCEKTSGAGTLSGGQWCFTWSSPKDTSVLVGIRCRDACDTCTASFRVTILFKSPVPPCAGNIAPVCKLPRDTTILQCIPTIVSLPVSATDANGNFKKCQIVSGPGSISSQGNWVYTPYGQDTVHVTIRCVDSCDAYCEGSFTVSFVADNLKPVCKPILDTTIHACPSVPIMIPLYTQAIGLVDCYIYSGPGTLVDGFWVYTPTVAGDVRASARCRTVCGNTWQWALTVRVRLDGTNCLGTTITVTPGGGPATSASVSRVDPCACPMPGDIDENGDVSVSDLAILTDVVYSKLQPGSAGSCPAIAQCDVNCDGVVDHKDVAALTAYIFKQGTSLCDPCTNRTTSAGKPVKK